MRHLEIAIRTAVIAVIAAPLSGCLLPIPLSPVAGTFQCSGNHFSSVCTTKSDQVLNFRLGMSRSEALAVACKNLASRTFWTFSGARTPSAGAASGPDAVFFSGCPDPSKLEGLVEWEFVSKSLCNEPEDKLRLEFSEDKLRRFVVVCGIGSF